MNIHGRIAKLRTEGMSAAKIAVFLNRNRIKTNTGKTWSQANVYSYLSSKPTVSTARSDESDFLETVISHTQLSLGQKSKLIRTYLSA